MTNTSRSKKLTIKEKMRFAISPRRRSRLSVVSACLAAATALVASNSLAQGPFLQYSADAYGTYAFVGSTVVVGKTAPVGIGPGCGTAQVGQTVNGTVLSLNAPPVAVTGLVNTSASDSLNSATASSDVHEIALLGALITATEVKAVSTTSQDGTGFQVSAAGSSLVILNVAGTVFTSVPAPNTTIQLAGFGRVVLNEQIARTSGRRAELTVNMIHVYITDSNVLGIGVGTEIIVAHAHSGLTQINGPASLDGTAYGTRVQSQIIRSSPTAPVSVGCQGHALRTATLVGITVPGVLSSGTIQDTAQGSVTLAMSSADTTASIQTADLLNGIVTATVIHAEAHASTTDGTTFNFSDSGSSFATLSVAGHPEITANVAPNTQVPLAGIGTLYLHRVTQTSNNILVRMIMVVLAPGNTLGLPAGLVVEVGHASASLHSPTHPAALPTGQVDVGVASASLDCPTCPALQTGTEVDGESALDSSEHP